MVRPGGFEDPQAERPERADQGEVVPVGRLPGGEAATFVRLESGL